MLHDDWQKFLAAQADKPSAATPVRGQVVWLQTWAALRFSGPDARTFLQGYLTSDTADLTPDRLVPTAICNLKGRVVVNGWCCAHGANDVRLLVHRSLVPRLADFLKPYLMFAKTEMIDGTASLLIIGVQPAAAETSGFLLGDQRIRLAADYRSYRGSFLAADAGVGRCGGSKFQQGMLSGTGGRRPGAASRRGKAPAQIADLGRRPPTGAWPGDYRQHRPQRRYRRERNQ